MAITSETSAVEYEGNDSTSTAYVVPFLFFSNAHLKVTVTDADDVATVLALTTDYAVTGANNPSGGTVVTVEAYDDTHTVRIERVVPVTQPFVYEEGGRLPMKTLEKNFDTLAMQVQQLHRAVDEIELMPGPTGATGPAGADGADGAEPTTESVLALVSEDPTGFRNKTSEFASLREYIAASCLRANVKAAGGNFAQRWASPGPLYDSYGQFPADAAYTTLGLAELGDYAAAWEVLVSFGESQNGSTGFIPRWTKVDGTLDTSASGNATTSQWPMLAHTAWQLYSKGGTAADTAKLETVYNIAKAWHTWWETNRQDASGLVFPGCNYNAGEATIRKLGMDEMAMDRCGVANRNAVTAGSLFSGSNYGHDHCCPVLNSLLVMEADALALIADELGESADVTTYQNKATARRLTMNRLMWDEEQGWYQRVLRSDKAINRTTVVSLSGTTLILAGGADYSIIPYGEVLVFSNGQAAQAAKNPARLDGNWQFSPSAQPAGERTIQLITAPTGVTNGTAVVGRSFSYYKVMPEAALALHARIPTLASGRADRLVKNVHKIFDGSEPDTFQVTFFGAAYGLSSKKAQWVTWYLNSNGVGVSTGGSILQVTSASTLSLTYRNQGVDEYGLYSTISNLRNFVFDDRTLEASRNARPTSFGIHFQRPGATEPTLIIKNYQAPVENGVAVVLSSPLVAPAGVGSPLITTGGAYSGPDVVGIGEFTFSGTTYIFSMTATTYPVGYVFKSPFGLITSSRLGDAFFNRPPDASPQYEQDDTYWQPGIWAHFQWHWFKGLQNYGYHVESQNHARKFIGAWNGAFQETGDVKEYLTPSGQARGATQYAWSGAAILLVLNETGL